ncbi:hypothetical protein [Peptococcus simiae]|uniref:hypothetical protein n=1 Tax=Peptococcus simiae TaxID=1643805 RepID=UPI003980FE3B
MTHTTGTRVVFADSQEEAKKEYEALCVQPEHDAQAKMDICKCSEEEDFDFDSPFNLIGEVSLSPEYMELVNKDPQRAYVIYYLEEA